mgnify:CR=1 FL=1
MKKQLIFLFSTLLMISIVSNNQKNNQEILNETTTIKNNDTKIKLLQNNQENTVDDYQCSKIFTQYGKDDNNEYLRFAIAIKGDVSSVKYTRVISSIDNQVEPIKMFSVNCLYNGIKNGDEISYYSDNGELVSEKTDYYWACYTIKFTNTSKYKDKDISVFVSINDKERSSATKSLNEEKNNAQKYDVWDGITENDFTKSEGQNADTYGTENDPYLIKTSNDMAFFANEVKKGNGFDGKYIKLTKDLDMTNPKFTGIGDGDLVNGKWSTKEFKGNFDGDNHDVKLCVNKSYMAGLFNASSGTIKNVTTSGIVYTQNRVAGGVVGYLNGGTVENVTNNAFVTGKFKETDILSGKGHIGGVIGLLQTGSVSNLTNNGFVYGNVTKYEDNQGVGGVIGTIEKNATAVNDLKNYGYVRNEGFNTGGTIGVIRKNDIEIKTLTNEGVISGKEGTGGVIGILNFSRVKIDGAINKGYVKGTSYVGGIMGALGYTGNMASTLSNSTNNGKVEATLENSKGGYRCGGIVGMAYGTTVNKCINNGEVIVKEKNIVPSDQYGDSSKTKYVGYIVGFKTGQGKVEECTNNFGK